MGTALFPAISLPCLSKPQFYFPPLKTKPSIFTFSSFELIQSHIFQNAKQKVTQYCTISNEFLCDDTVLFREWPELIKVSIESGDFFLGQAIHAYLVKSGSHYDPFEGNNLLILYVKFRRLDLARRVFDGMLARNTITWTSLIKGCLEDNDFHSAFNVAAEMHKFGEKFNEHTCTVILQACRSFNDWILGEQIHCFAIKSGFDGNVFIGSSLIAMYTQSGSLGDAEKVFDGMDYKDVRCLNSMILEYGRAGNGEKAIEVFIYLLNAGFMPNAYTFTNIISACNGDLDVEEGKQLQGLAFKYGFLSETATGNAIINMYGKKGMTEEAERMFSAISDQNLISWTALISSYTRSGYGKKAIDAFWELQDYGVKFDSTLLTTILDACSECNNLELGLQIHGIVVKLGYAYDVNIGTALVDLYAKCRNLLSSRKIFDGLSSKITAALNAILVGFTENSGYEEDLMFLFNQIRVDGNEPDMVTFSRLLSLSANQASLGKGRSLHAYTFKTGLEADLSVSNAVITMYAKCGSIEDANQMFNLMNDHDIVSWNSIISAYALHGQGQKALLLFEEMKKKEFIPDEITLLAILQACTYSGLWQDGICLFNIMEPKYGIKPLLEHYACVVDLLGRAGHLSEAMDVINKSPFSKSTLLWRTLVNVCKLCGDLNLGKLASKHLLDLSPDEAGSYILVSNMYAGQRMLYEAAKVRTVMNDLKLSKEAGSSWIEIDNKVHHFVANGRDHPESREIFEQLYSLRDDMRWRYDRTEFNLTEDFCK